MSSNPAIAGRILRNFSIVAVVALTGVYASDRIISIASRKQMGLRGERGVYNASVHPEQDPLYVLNPPYNCARTIEFELSKGVLTLSVNRDTILDRKNLMNAAKAKKPWNMTLAEKELARRSEGVKH
ncbi:hypothetical protein LOCC1_G003466 [Lachnellula occidentalis]|uniref:Uncharacterized protein n=1 Tax=Lachnellula occidentalis TaxID=215460 RepID=A0A8H8UFZ2_9HELO|nr:hypothetical protein LOCC1_G003466 [Lachnellula occidentalis]